MINRVALLLCLDTTMLLLVCVLECLALTGLELHEWLGFAFCPLVLVHVVMQWQWFITQFQRVMKAGAYRVRINALLNLALLFMMSAVLLSGVLVSRQVKSMVGEGFGRVRIWSEIHGGLNFVLVVLVGLHLALNWDWIIAALRRRRPERPGIARGPSPNAGEQFRPRSLSLANSLGRGLTVLLIESLAASAVYLTLAAVTNHPEEPVPPQNEPAAAVRIGERRQLPPQSHPVALPHGFEQLIATTSALVLVVIIGRYVFRLRL